MAPRRFVLVVALLAAVGFFLTLCSAPACAVTARILYRFRGGADGGWPWATLTLDQKTGVLYGTTEVGGDPACQNSFQYGCGTVFAVTPLRQSWAETVLYRFHGGADGAHPRAPLVHRPDGFFYSTTTTGGGGYNGGVGTIYRIMPGTWNEQVVFSFGPYSGGWYPQGEIAFDSTGDIYGLTPNAGAGTGVVYEVMPSPSGPWTEQVLSSQVSVPYAGVANDPLGNVFGADASGGAHNEGSVFEVSPGPSGWQLTDIYSFLIPCGMFCGGAIPGDLTLRKSGDLFGFAGDAGVQACNGHSCGTVFELTNSGGIWKEKTIYAFQNLADGWAPGLGRPVFDSAGNMYGATGGGGEFGFGTVFKLSHAPGGWQKTTLYSFTGGPGGAAPIGGVVLDTHGDIFGTTYIGGNAGGKTCKKDGCGIVFELSP